MEKIDLGYRPRKHQKWLHAQMRRFNVIVAHRRLGKSVYALNDMLDTLFRCSLKNPQGVYAAPTYSQAERVIWKMIKEEIDKVPGVKKNEQKLRLDIPRKHDSIRFMLMGAENPGSLKGIYLDDVVLDEFAEMNGNIWGEVFRPALADRQGKAKFIGTPKGANAFRDMYMAARRAMKDGNDNWFAAKFKASDTGVIPKEELEEAKRTMSEAEYLQEFECDFTVGLSGAYYGRQMRDAESEGRITRVPFNPALPVYTGWDLGIDDATAIWFAQEAGKELHVIEYMEFRDKGLEEIVPVLKNKPYTYAEHYLPHDAGARELGSGKTRQETLYNLGLGSKDRLVVLGKHKIEDGIQASRQMLPRCYFDFYHCEDGIESLKSYEKVYDSKEGVYRSKPRHNWASHGADAFRSLATGFRPEEYRTDISFLPREAEDLNYDILGEM